jgi:Family of unknown function (DUF5693)
VAVRPRELWARYPILSALVAVGLVAGVVVLIQRYQVEISHRTVEITVDGDDWITLTRRTGADRDAMYDALYQAGARSITVYASSLKRLQDAGRLTYLTGADLVNGGRTGVERGPLAELFRAGRIRAGNTYVVGPPAVLEFVRAGFAAQLPPHAGRARVVLLGSRNPTLEIEGRGQEIEDAPLGLFAEDVTGARAHHLAVEARLRNVHELAPDGLASMFAGLRTLGEQLTLIFDGNQVLGYEELIPDVAEQMTASRFAFGQIESFTARRRQRGDLALSMKMIPNVVRVFSLTPEELAVLAPEEARDKYVLAARERNVRVLYVRPFLLTSAGVDELQANLDYIRSIKDDLRRAGYEMGKASVFPNLRIAPWWFGLLAAAALAAAAIALGEMASVFALPISPRVLHAGVAAGLVATGAAAAAHHLTLWSQALALLAALAFPSLSLLGVVPREAPGGDGRDGAVPRATAGGRVILASIGRLWGLSAMSALGGVLVAALLSQWVFMLEIRGFLGVKPAHVIPVALLGLALAAADAPRGELWPRLRAWARQPLLLEYGIAVILVGVAIVFALGRTGNAGLPALGALEVKSRVLLEHLVVARPRTKEYLIGHPFMVLTFALMALGLRRWVLPAAVLGAIGQVGLVNSFSHIHTPLVYVLLRTLYALIFGSALGAALVAIVLWSRGRSPRVPALRAAERARPAPLEMPPVR